MDRHYEKLIECLAVRWGLGKGGEGKDYLQSPGLLG